jgi:hypothetical protein
MIAAASGLLVPALLLGFNPFLTMKSVALRSGAALQCGFSETRR